MRLITEIAGDPRVKRLMLAPEPTGCFIFLFDALEDRPCFADQWCESLAEAKALCLRTYGVPVDRWTEIAEAPEGCMQDRIAVVPAEKPKTR